MNKQNVHYWSAENLKEIIYDYPLPAGKVTVWDHLAVFFVDNEGRSKLFITVNYSVRYAAVNTPQLCLLEMY